VIGVAMKNSCFKNTKAITGVSFVFLKIRKILLPKPIITLNVLLIKHGVG